MYIILIVTTLMPLSRSDIEKIISKNYKEIVKTMQYSLSTPKIEIVA